MEHFHIGELIKNQMEKQRFPASLLADKIFCKRQNIYKIFEKDDISAKQLERIADALDYDFFAHYSERLKKKKSSKQ